MLLNSINHQCIFHLLSQATWEVNQPMGGDVKNVISSFYWIMLFLCREMAHRANVICCISYPISNENILFHLISSHPISSHLIHLISSISSHPSHLISAHLSSHPSHLTHLIPSHLTPSHPSHLIPTHPISSHLIHLIPSHLSSHPSHLTYLIPYHLIHLI